MSAKRAEHLLTEWVNIRDNAVAVRRFLRLHPEVRVPTEAGKLGGSDEVHETYVVLRVHWFLRKAWDNSGDFRQFDWYTTKALFSYLSEALTIDSDDPPASIDPVEQAIVHFRQNRRRALRCPNPECPAPYCFQNKKGQKFCGVTCSLASYRASKRRWAKNDRIKKARKK